MAGIKMGTKVKVTLEQNGQSYDVPGVVVGSFMNTQKKSIYVAELEGGMYEIRPKEEMLKFVVA